VLTSAEQRRQRAAELFALIESGKLLVPIAARFALADGAAAHALLEARQTVGKVILLP
jgi:NADPH2:quinone reductase